MHALVLFGLTAGLPILAPDGAAEVAPATPRVPTEISVPAPRYIATTAGATTTAALAADATTTAVPTADTPSTTGPTAEPTTATAPTTEPTTTAAPTADATPARRRPRPARDPWDWRFVGAHYGTGVMASLLVLPGSYGLAGWVGHRGHGLGPVVGAMLLGAFLPPVLTYTTQWAVGRHLAPRRERYWPGFLVHQIGHLGVFAGAVLGGADFRVFADVAPVVLTDALVVTGLGTLTAEATRRPLPPPPPTGALLPSPWAAARLEVIVPVVEVHLP